MRLHGRRYLFLAAFCLLCSAAISYAESSETCSLVIHVDGIRNEKGVIGASIFNSPNGWPESNDKSFRHGPATFTGTAGTITFDGIPAGDYAVVAIHDENKNHKLDRNFVGWPLEGFGFANNPKVGLITPAFKEALTHVSCPKTEITIHLQYK
jgi:uncharacterized protein (DUF2141 family)